MEAPEPIKRAFAQLKLEYPFYISLSKINGKYYVYRSHSAWDKESRKVKTKKEYLGRIVDKGEYIKKAIRPDQAAPPMPAYKFDEIDEKILTHLSMNCRLPVSVIAKRVGLSAQATERRKENLERRYGIRYLASINYVKLGYSPYLAFVNFREKKPNVEVLKAALEKEPRIQLAMSAQGAYDLILYVLVENSFLLDEVISNIRSDENLKDYESIWNTVAFDESYGYVPLRDKFFELVEKKVWRRSKETPKPTSDNLTQREYILLREMNADCSKPFADIEREHDLGHGAARYTFDRLIEKELVWRQTLTMRGYNVNYNAMILMTTNNKGAFLKDRAKLLQYIIKVYEAPSNRFALVGGILSPDGIIFIAPILRDGELEIELEWLGSQIAGITLNSVIITKIILGELCYRKLDNKHAKQMNILINEYKIEPPKNTLNYLIE